MMMWHTSEDLVSQQQRRVTTSSRGSKATLAALERGHDGDDDNGDGGGGAAKALLMGHIPPALSSNVFAPTWHARYARRYLALVANHSRVVVAQLFGHLHTDEVTVEPSSDGCVSRVRISWSLNHCDVTAVRVPGSSFPATSSASYPRRTRRTRRRRSS